MLQPKNIGKRLGIDETMLHKDLMTRKDYDVEHLIGLLKGLRERYPNLRIILERGSALTWQTGPLVASVVDVVESRGIRTAILDVSFTI